MTRHLHLSIAASLNSTVVNKEPNVDKYASRLKQFKAGQSPTTFRPERKRSFQPGLSWLGDDEFETSGLAFKLARHHMRRVAENKLASASDSDKNASRDAEPGYGPRKGVERTKTRARASDRPGNEASNPRREYRPKKVDTTKTEASRNVKTGAAKQQAASRPTLKPSPAPKMPVQVDLGSTDFTSLFGAPPSLSPKDLSTSTRITPTDATSRRVQLALECHGGDYSKLVPEPLATSKGSPIVYAASTLGRRRDLGPNMKNNALEIIRSMAGRSLGSQQTS